MAKTIREKVGELVAKADLNELKLIHSDTSATLLEKVEERRLSLMNEMDNLNSLKEEIENGK